MNKNNFLVSSINIAFLFIGSDIHAQNTSALQTANNQGANAAVIVTSNNPIPWAYISEKDITWKKRVWREIDGHDKGNAAFSYTEGSPHNNMLINILIDGVTSGTIKAYSATDDKFTTTLTKEEFIKLVAPGNSSFNLEKIYKFRIKEDWLFTRNTGTITVRIAGIAPEVDITTTDGTVTSQPLFWIYYPDCRGILAQHQVYKLEKDSKPITWNEYFESRQYNSKIDKVSDSKFKVVSPENRESSDKIEKEFEIINQVKH